MWKALTASRRVNPFSPFVIPSVSVVTALLVFAKTTRRSEEAASNSRRGTTYRSSALRGSW